MKHALRSLSLLLLLCASCAAQVFVHRYKNPAPSSTNFVTTYTPPGSTTSLVGMFGFRFTTNQAITVKELCRWKLAGNTQTHTVKIVRNSDNAEMATADVDLSAGSAGGFVCQSITPVSLPSGGVYNIASAETAGGDPYYDALAAGTGTVTTAVATINGAASSSSWTFFGLDFSGNWLYVPVSFKYS
jgi:hypothetical protein